MKQKMLNRKFLGLLFFLSMGVISQSYAQYANYLYVYAPGGSTQSLALDNIQKITFTSDELQVHSATEGITTVGYDNIAKLSFTLPPSSVESPSHKTVKVYWEAFTDNVVVKSATSVSTVNIFDMRGVLLQCVQPQSPEAIIPMSAFPIGIYLLQVGNEEGVSIHKILKQ